MGPQRIMVAPAHHVNTPRRLRIRDRARKMASPTGAPHEVSDLTDIGADMSPESDDGATRLRGEAGAGPERRHRARAARADAEELLDSGRLSMEEVEQNLVDLARLNGLPGGTRASIGAIRRLAGATSDVRILDAGTGRADMPAAFVRHGWRTVGLDVNPDVLLVARRVTAHQPAIEIVEGDVRRLPFADDTFDVAHCSLLVHHLDPDDAVIGLRELARVARLGVVVNDLRRGTLPRAATWLTVHALGRSPVTRQDGMTSARRAYTLDELDGLLASAGLAARWRSTPWFPRVVTAAARA